MLHKRYQWRNEMSKERKIVIYTLIGLNVVLLMCLAHANISKAHAASRFKSTDYTISVGKISGANDAITIIDEAKGKMAVIYYDRQQRKIVQAGGTKALEWAK